MNVRYTLLSGHPQILKVGGDGGIEKKVVGAAVRSWQG